MRVLRTLISLSGWASLAFGLRAFGIPSDFDLRTSDFLYAPCPCYCYICLIHCSSFNPARRSSPNTLFLGPAMRPGYGGRMELRHLRYFVAVAEELNFTHAAARLRVAQPALSRQIKDLEDELQTPLFERGHTGVQLTRAGKVLHQRARAILAQATEAANEARAAAGAITGSLVLGFPSGLHLNYLAPVIQAFKRIHPKVQFDYFHGLGVQQLKALREGRIDVAFVNLPASLDGLNHQVIWRVPFKVVLPQRHPLARRAALELADLRSEDFVFSTREARPEFYDEFFRLCANAGFRPRVVKEVGGYPTNMLGLISVGLGVSVLPHFERIERISGIVWRTLSQPRLWWDWVLVWRRQGVSRMVEQFVAVAEKKLPLPPESNRAEF
jgi:DNA-binding transcriptional LysR family regulator